MSPARLSLVSCAIVFALPAVAEAPALHCAGTAPDWRVELTGDSARFSLRDRSSSYDIPHTAEALNEPGVVAYTLIGAMDTAILVVTPQDCNTDTLAAHLLTQDGEEAILLTGCCSRS